MDTKVVYLHGIGGATKEWEWVYGLNDSLVACGFDELMPDDVIDFDYSALLDKEESGDETEPAVTLSAADRGERWQSEYILRQGAIRSWVLNSQFTDSAWTPPVPDGLGQVGQLGSLGHFPLG